ncbi:MAG TPA: helix-turn-helix transcriptional regulator, partial [Verrucomicrobiae bacterium]|nr:helix-turn-helix transcriptional regulator [Verrucomicrobiae bacterium]
LNIVGPQLQLLRKWRRMSQRELSLKLCWLGWKVSRNGLAQMEITRKRITDCDLIFLAKALDVNITDFFPTTFSQRTLRSKIKSNRLMAWRPASLRPTRTAGRRIDFKEKKRRSH